MKIYYIIFIIIVVYIYCYFIFPPDISILQTSIDNYDFNMLLKRQPLVLEDHNKKILNVINSLFSGNIIKDVKFDKKYIWNLNVYKYLYIYALNDTEILLYPPKIKVLNDTPNNNEPVVSIMLHKYQSVIIPFRWYYNIKNIEDTKLYGIHDYITYLLDFI